MYNMANEYGNCHMVAKTEREKEQLLQRGFHIEEPSTPVSAPRKRKAGKKSEGQKD